MSASVSILWFRRDLRLHDNAALEWACQHSDAVIPIYIDSPLEEGVWQAGAASRWWLHNSLLALEKSLAEFDLKLRYFSGDTKSIILKLIDEVGADSLVYNKLYERHIYDRDIAIEKALSAKLKVLAFDGALFFTPGTVLNKQQLPYRVFTPFYKNLRQRLMPEREVGGLQIVAKRLNAPSNSTVSGEQTLSSLNLIDRHGWSDNFFSYWSPGEGQALDLLDVFMRDAITRYEFGRDVPSDEATSRLSPHLHFGEITPRQIISIIWPIIEGECGEKSAQSAEVFLKQLVWREFASNVLWHFPETATEPMDKRYSDTFWRNSQVDYDAWTKGRTGVPIVDAGMRQLWRTGWMHNRVRMIVSSFLTKNLGVHWRQGAAWFWDTLVDANLANNSMGWQWVAGCGVDAAPYYRVFNPSTQTKRFDKNLKYIHTWLPEYAELDYPQPMVDLADSRQQALNRYKQNIHSNICS